MYVCSKSEPTRLSAWNEPSTHKVNELLNPSGARLDLPNENITVPVLEGLDEIVRRILRVCSGCKQHIYHRKDEEMNQHTVSGQRRLFGDRLVNPNKMPVSTHERGGYLLYGYYCL